MNIHDQITAANAGTASKGAFAILDTVQDQPPGEQILSAAILLLLWCRKYDENPRDVLTTASKVFREGLTNNNIHINALRHFLKVDIDDATSLFL